MLFADSGFPEGATNPKRGRLIYYFRPLLPQKCMKLKIIRPTEWEGVHPFWVFYVSYNGMNYQFVVLDFNVWATLV